MSVVDNASIASDPDPAEDPRQLSGWALSRRLPDEQVVAIELVLVHDFGERLPAPPSGPVAEHAQSVREEYLLELTGLAAVREAQTASPATRTEPQRATVRVRGAAYERRAWAGRAAAASR